MEPNKIDRHQIVDAAMSIMQADGIEGLSMRKLAAKLHIRAPTLYWYFPDRSSILHEVIKTLFLEIISGVPECSTWQGWLRAFGRQLWATNKRMPFVIILLQSAELNDGEIFHLAVSRLSAMTEKFGVDFTGFLEAQSHIQAMIVGWAVFEQAGVAARLGDYLDIEQVIEDGIDGVVLLHERKFKDAASAARKARGAAR